MWNISSSSAADSRRGSAKKLRENTSKARWCAASGKRTLSRNAVAVTPSKRSYTWGTRTSRSGRAARGSIAARSRHPKVGLRATNPIALRGGVRGTRAKPSVRPPLCRKG